MKFLDGFLYDCLYLVALFFGAMSVGAGFYFGVRVMGTFIGALHG